MANKGRRRRHSPRQPNDTQSAPPRTNDNPVAQAEARAHSDMYTSQRLALAFGTLSMPNSSISLQPGTWAADLAFLISDDDAATTYLESADLDMLHKDFSISTYLSSAGAGQVAPNVILQNGQPIDGALLVCLAMNEECRKKGNAAFYHLPSRQSEEVGHAADLVFVSKSWTREDRYGWDSTGWLQRLEMYGVDGNCYDKIDRSALVIPICSRILRFEAPCKLPHPHPTTAHPQDVLPVHPSPNYSPDPAVFKNVYRYSRPLQDLSTYLILYPSIATPPLVCPTNIFEGTAHSDRHPTPNDISETFTLRIQGAARNAGAEAWKPLHHGMVAKAMYEASRKRYLAAGNPTGTNAQVVECLLQAWNDEARGFYDREKTESGDMVRYSWQELMNVMDVGLKTSDLIKNWPRT